MSDDDGTDQYGSRRGNSVLLISLPDLDPQLEPWIEQATSVGITAHVTVLGPFLPEDELTADVLAELRDVFSGFAAFDLTFARTARFPEVLYLVPEPDQLVRDLTSAVFARWPQCPPYEGEFDDPTPHATVVHAKPEPEYEAARLVLETRLPLRARAAAVDLLVFDGSRWNVRERFPLAER